MRNRRTETHIDKLIEIKIRGRDKIIRREGEREVGEKERVC